MAKTVSSFEITLHRRPEHQTRAMWLYNELRTAILDGRLKYGSRLPATRDFARLHSLLRGTVVTVFERLPNYIQHNPDTPDSPAAFVESTKKLIARNPDLGVEIKRVIAEDDLVVTHDLVKSSPGQLGMAGIDIFRLEDGKIVEHWDVRQPVPENAANGNTMF